MHLFPKLTVKVNNIAILKIKINYIKYEKLNKKIYKKFIFVFFIIFGSFLIIKQHFAIQKIIFILFNYYNYYSNLA